MNSGSNRSEIQVTMFMRHPESDKHSIEELFAAVRSNLPVDIVVTLVILGQPSRRALPRLRNMWEAYRRQGHVNHITGDVNYLALILPGRKTVLTIHDLGSADDSRNLRRWIIRLLWFRLPTRRVTAITTVSQFTSDCLTQTLRDCSGKVKVIENPVHPVFVEAQQHDGRVDGPVLCIGTKSNKNLLRIFEALDGLGASLTVVGRLTKFQLREIERRNIEYENFHDLSQCQLLATYQRSSLLLFPSLGEGFGMPIIEAQTVGLPVITSNRDPMRVVSGGAAFLVDPESVDEIRKAVMTVLNDKALRAQLVSTGRVNARRFAAEKIASEYAEVYRRVAANATSAKVSP